MATTTTNSCCSTTIDAKCVVYGSTTVSATLDSHTISINKLLQTFDLTCLGGSSAVDVFGSMTFLITYLCDVVTPVFDTTCLGGPAAATTQEAISFLITRVCDATDAFPSFDTTCLGGAVGTGMEAAINELITAQCSTDIPGITLDWTCLTDPTSTDLEVILQSIMDQTKLNINSFTTDHFITDNVTDACIFAISLDEAKVNTFVFNDFTANNKFDTIIQNFLDTTAILEISATDLCTKRYLVDAFSVGPGLDMSQRCWDLHTYVFNVTINIAEWKFLSLTLPTGVEFDIPVAAQSDVALIETFFTDSIGLPVANVSITGGTQLTVTIQTYGNSTDFIPTAVIIPSTAEGEVIQQVNNATLTVGGDNCCTIHIELEPDPASPEECPVDVVGEDLVSVEKRLVNEAIWDGAGIATTTLNTFDYIIFNNVKYSPNTAIPLGDIPAVNSYLNSLGIGIASCSNINGVLPAITFNFRLTAFANESPVYALGGIEFSTTLTTTTTKVCEKFVVLHTYDDWKNVVYETGFTGAVQYRVVEDRVEVKGGDIRRSTAGSPTLTNSDMYRENAFSIPVIPTSIFSYELGCSWFSNAAFVVTPNPGPYTDFVERNYLNHESTNYSSPHKAILLNDDNSGLFALTFQRMQVIPAAGATPVEAFPINPGAVASGLEWIIPSFQYYI